MKDEEMARDYAWNYPIPYSLYEKIEDKKEQMGEVIEQAFLAGLKARQKWHILAEEPNVLPEEGQKVKVLTEEGDIENSTYFYDTYYEEFAWSNIGLLKVFAWCENPKLPKEDK